MYLRCLQGFVLEDATGLYLNGDVDVQSVFAASLPASHPSFAPQQHLEMFKKWQAPPLPNDQAELFIGVLSAGNHFAERMAVRKTWMQHELIRSSKIVARFFVALVRVVMGDVFNFTNLLCVNLNLNILTFSKICTFHVTEWKKGNKRGPKKRSRVFW